MTLWNNSYSYDGQWNIGEIPVKSLHKILVIILKIVYYHDVQSVME